jgi:hypothetical protein
MSSVIPAVQKCGFRRFRGIYASQLMTDFHAANTSADPPRTTTARVSCAFQSSMRRRVKSTSSSRQIAAAELRSGNDIAGLKPTFAAVCRVDAGRVAMPIGLHVHGRSMPLAAKGVNRNWRFPTCSKTENAFRNGTALQALESFELTCVRFRLWRKRGTSFADVFGYPHH